MLGQSVGGDAPRSTGKEKRPHAAAALTSGSILQISKDLLVDVVLRLQPLNRRLNEHLVLLRR